MTVATKLQPNYTTQQAAAYKAAIDGITAVHDRVAGAFAPHEQDVGSPAPELSMRVDAGFIFTNGALTEVSAQTVTGFTVPSAGQERIDRVVIDATTGVASRVAGTAASGSPSAVAPDIPAGKLPCCQIRFTDASTAVLNSMITDERSGQCGFPPFSQITNSLGSNVTLNDTGAFFTGPTIAQGTAGTWFASGTVTFYDSTTSGTFEVKLWDGTTVIASAVVVSPGANLLATCSLSGYLASPAGNIRISVKDVSSTGGLMTYNQSGTGKDCTLSAIRIG
jgi:hypothetical protein